MRFAWVLGLVACGGGGQSIPFEMCNHTGPDTTCCVSNVTCNGGRCAPPETRTVTGFCTTEEECSEGEFCDLAIMRCDELMCTTADDCPPNFECPSGSCQRLSCEDSSECEGFCVEGGCFQRAGECQFTPDF